MYKKYNCYTGESRSMSDSGRVLGDGRYAGPLEENSNLVCEVCGINYVQRGYLCKPVIEGSAHKWRYKTMYDCLMFHKVKMWRHVKTNNIYSILGISTCSTNGEQNGKQSVVYMSSEGELYNRDTVEFLDGRFEPMNSTAIKSLK